jgi:hypothetical protein
MRRWLIDEKNLKSILTGLSTGMSIGFVSVFFKGEHLLMRALLSAYIVAVLASLIEFFMKAPRSS